MQKSSGNKKKQIEINITPPYGGDLKINYRTHTGHIHYTYGTRQDTCRTHTGHIQDT